MDKKLLIAYFSHPGETFVGGKIEDRAVGNTAIAAQMVAKVTGGDLYEIATKEPYPHQYKETVAVAKAEFSANARPELTRAIPNIADYDGVVLGYPNWCGTMPMAVFTFLEQGNFDGVTILPFCTNEGSGMGHSEEDIRHTCPKANILPGLAILGREVGGAEGALRLWLSKNLENR